MSSAKTKAIDCRLDLHRALEAFGVSGTEAARLIVVSAYAALAVAQKFPAVRVPARFAR